MERIGKWRLLVILLFVVSLQGFAQDSNGKNDKNRKAKYIFYFIGDGMGLSQANVAEAYLGALENNNNGIKKLSFSKLPHAGFFTTNATNRFITGSAAAGTALATGYKTSLNTIAMDAAKQKPLKTVAEIARDKNYKVGIVSSVSLNHATPACFYAHQPTRNYFYKIGLDLGKSNFNYFAGGGFRNPEGDGKVDDKNTMANMGMASGGKLKSKETHLYDVVKSHGYQLINTCKKFSHLKNGDDKIIAITPRMARGESLPYGIDQNHENDISLAEFTKKGIELLDNSNGFFMMIEGGKIDWACHANDAATVIHEVLEFDKSVQVALDFYNKHPEETLIIVTADHETGGMGLGFSGKHYESELSLLQHQNISYEMFEARLKQYKKKHKGNYKVEDALAMVKKHFGLGDESKGLALADFEEEQLKEAFEKSLIYEKKMKYNDQFYLLYGSYDPLTVTACHLISQKAGIGWTTFSHTASPIPVRAIGIGGEQFSGFFDNAEMGSKVINILD